MRLIDVDALGIGKCNPDVFNDKTYANGWNSAIEILQNAPTVDDVAKVRHGHWEIKYKWEPLAWDTDPLDWDRYDEKTHSEEVDYYACSKCGYDGGSWKPSWKYCPHCGAKMDGEDEK